MNLNNLAKKFSLLLTVIGLLPISILNGCSSESKSTSNTIKVLTYDSFSLDKKLLADFEKQVGQKVQIITSGGGELVNKEAVLN